MIPTIGIMIGAYIITRMIDLLMQEKTGIVVSLFAVLTLIVTGIGLFILLVGGASTAALGTSIRGMP